MEMNLSKLRKISRWRTLLFGFLAVAFGLIIIVNGVNFTKVAIDLLMSYFFLVGLVNLFLHFIVGKKEVPVIPEIVRIVLANLIGLLNRLSSLPVDIVIIILGIYQLATAAVYGITYYLYRKNQSKGALRFLLDTVLYGLIGLATVFSPSVNGQVQFFFLGMYLVMLGFSNIRDGLFFDNDRERTQLRRHIRINLPIILAAFIPAENLDQFNRFIRGQNVHEPTQTVYSLVKDEKKTADLEVLVHTSKESLFGAIGHVDICYQGQVISYGSYDVFSERCKGMIGDGVLFKVSKDDYIELCKKESKKTLFGYSLSLTEQEREAVEKRLAQIDQWLIEWEPPADLKDGRHTYAYKLRHELGARLYKFTTSRFKTYFVMSTNCCLLADSIIGQAGTDMLDIRGIIAPGTYQSYLQYEFESANDLVIARTVYQ
ncbi:DUF308 domain-containing protein [Streptococcus panodentis]|uniref:DUF308 domain-containing protein n=1 Tax=Streptococcus panodentis TaxID=1581472 RepID=A0ABS5AVN3_9STRE|nr:DUF308 domain-containing protein [Streptococcus panodentis]MBP2620620.1 hypothetical protein [Streptococcus panodentis]